MKPRRNMLGNPLKTFDFAGNIFTSVQPTLIGEV